MCSSLMSHANTQHGFRPGRSRKAKLLKMVSNAVNNMRLGLQTDICVLEFSNAFDKVDHRCLVEKLRMYETGGGANTWIDNFRSNWSQYVLAENACSVCVPVIFGAPQGAAGGANAPAYWAPASLIRPTPKKIPVA